MAFLRGEVKKNMFSNGENMVDWKIHVQYLILHLDVATEKIPQEDGLHDLSFDDIP